MLVRFAYLQDQYSYTLLILPVSLALILFERGLTTIKPTWCPVGGMALLMA